MTPGMPAHLQKRIFLFYLGGVINVFLGLYVLIEGTSLMSREKAMWLVTFFFAFAAVDFWFPHALRKKWLADQGRPGAGQPAVGRGDGQKS
jgi:hypothetical protein